MHRSCPAAPPHLPPICRQVETLKQRKKEEREKEKQAPPRPTSPDRLARSHLDPPDRLALLDLLFDLAVHTMTSP